MNLGCAFGSLLLPRESFWHLWGSWTSGSELCLLLILPLKGSGEGDGDTFSLPVALHKKSYLLKWLRSGWSLQLIVCKLILCVSINWCHGSLQEARKRQRVKSSHLKWKSNKYLFWVLEHYRFCLLYALPCDNLCLLSPSSFTPLAALILTTFSKRTSPWAYRFYSFFLLVSPIFMLLYMKSGYQSSWNSYGMSMPSEILWITMQTSGDIYCWASVHKQNLDSTYRASSFSNHCRSMQSIWPQGSYWG